MSGLQDYLANMGFGTSKATSNAQGNIGQAQEDFAGLTPPKFNPVSLSGPERAADATAATEGPSAMNGVSTDPAYKQAQMAQMSALSGLAANGGRSAASDANLAQIQQGENQNARGQRDAILASADRRGQGGSGASLLAQLDSSQHAVDRQSAEDLGVAGQQAQTAIQAGQGAAGIGAGLESQSFGEGAARAQANDVVDRFNAQNSTGVSEFNSGKNQGVNNASAAAGNQGQVLNNFEMPQQGFEDSYQKASGQAGAAMGAANYWGQQSAIGAQQAGNLTGSAVKLGTAAAAHTPAAAHGGRVPGVAPVPGDSPLNDIVPVQTSPGEVVVPRTLAQGGSSKAISDFVKAAPPISPAQSADRKKEAMLSALKHLATKGGQK